MPSVTASAPLRAMLRLAASLGLLAALLLVLEPQRLAAAFSAPAPHWLAAALALSVPQVVLSAWRWRFTATRLGAPLGLAGAVGLGLAMRSQLYGVSFADPISFAAAVVLLACAVVAAAGLRAWRASRLNVVRALREQ